jgi:CelD/BcsL family acetyltransferase involved in cellulose biosynthesis
MSQTLTAHDEVAGTTQASKDGPGRRRRRRDSSTLSVARISTFGEASEIVDEWRGLFATSAAGNPFASPEWLLPWAHHFVPECDLALLAVRRDGALVGLAPWYFKRVRGLPCRLHLLGSGRHDALTELPQILTAQGESRSVLRAVMGEWSRAAAEWDWLELPIMSEQGWFEPEWLTGGVGERGLVLHKTTRAAVTLDLPVDVPALHRGLKRNLLESTHRARNRLNRSQSPWEVTVHEGQDGIAHALPVLARLHATRADLAGRRHHPDQLAESARRAFLEDALSGMARYRQAQILTLDVGGDPVAAQLVLLAPDATYLGMSGVDPAWWQVNAVTLLQLRAAEAAVERGHRTFNLSVGPSVAKLRWSEQVRQHPEFIVCGPRRSSQIAFTAYRLAAAAAAVRREAVRHRATASKKEASRAHHAAH